MQIKRSELKEMVKRILKETINEVSGWTLEADDIEWVNDTEDKDFNPHSSLDDKPWIVRLWPGSGYYLPAFGVWAKNEEDALEKVVAYLDQEGNDDFFLDDYVEELRDQMTDDGEDEEAMWSAIDDDDTMMYVDATMEGASQPHYIYAENLDIYPYSKFKNED